MRSTRWLILLAIVAILGGSAYYYQKLKRENRNNIPKAPPVMSSNTNLDALNYEYAQSSGGFASVEVKAKTFREVRDTPDYDLTDLVLKLNQKDKKHYDLIKSAKARFNQDEARMYAEGDVEITLDVPIDDNIKHKLTTIKTSGVTFDSKSGKAVTDRPTEFTFENGGGKCTGANYDPATRDLHLLHDATMTMTGKGPNAKPLTVEAEEIVYRESASVVWLLQWAKMVRGETTITAGPSIVNLKHGKVDSIDSQKAVGVDEYPNRSLHYSADVLHVTYDENGQPNKINAVGNTKMRQEGEGAVTELSSRNADLDFRTTKTESLLSHVLASGDGVITSRPLPGANGKLAESHTLKSDQLDITMRPDGRNIDVLKTNTPGVLEFIPNEPDQHHRFLNSEQMTIAYADKNVLKSFHGLNATTLTFPPASSKAKNPASSKTASKSLDATFDAKGQLATMRQVDNFTYEEGDRRAKAVTATLDQNANTMDLETGARIWDANGSTDADKIHMMQKTGDYVADGHVSTSHMPDQDDPKKTKGGQMLDGDQTIQGSAPHMTSANHNKLVHYDGGAVLWQGADRLEAQSIDIDRDKHLLTATGKVTTQFLDEDKKDGVTKVTADASDTARIVKASVPIATPASSAKPSAPSSPASPVYTVVTAEKLVYTDADRLAHYSGNVDLSRPGLHVKSAELQAYLNPKDHPDDDSRLNHAVGDGNVEITESRPDRKRIGRGIHGEYTTADDKVVLRGNLADLYDSLKKDESHGSELTYYTTDDRLVITGAPSKPVTSRLHRKTHANANSGNR